MIEPTSKDIGRFVIYMDGSPTPNVEAGRIHSFNEQTVFVRFPKRYVEETSTQGCDRSMLWWLDDVAAMLRGANAKG